MGILTAAATAGLAEIERHLKPLALEIRECQGSQDISWDGGAVKAGLRSPANLPQSPRKGGGLGGNLRLMFGRPRVVLCKGGGVMVNWGARGKAALVVIAAISLAGCQGSNIGGMGSWFESSPPPPPAASGARPVLLHRTLSAAGASPPTTGTRIGPGPNRRPRASAGSRLSSAAVRPAA